MDATDGVLTHPVDTDTEDDSVLRGSPAVLVGIDILRPFSDNLGDASATYAYWLNPRQGPTAPGEVVCLSCHAAHDADPGTPIFRKQKDTDGYAGGGICDNCHGGDIFAGRASHPQGPGVTNVNDASEAWPNNGALPINWGTSSDEMWCETCHAGHNGEVGARFMLRRTDANSQICVDCHTDTDTTTQTTPFPATNLSTEQSDSANPSGYIQERYYDGTYDSSAAGSRMGTHAAYRTIKATPGAGEIDHDLWKASLGSGTLKSSYGVGGLVIVCQSCHTPHDADPVGGWGGSGDVNGIPSKNLLYQQNGQDLGHTGSNGGNTGNDAQDSYDPTTDTICQGCHVPDGTHPVQDWTVSRTAAAVNTASAFAKAGVIPKPTDYTSADVMTCESCHAPHAAASATGSWILEDGDAGTPGTGGERVDSRNRDPLCDLCHGY
jgi:predicted CXXCH cytochrome family protein